MEEPFVFVAERPVPELGIQVGERVVVRPGTRYPVVIQRDAVPNYGLILLAFETGELRALTPTSPSELRAAVGLDAPPPPSARTRSGRRYLSVLR